MIDTSKPSESEYACSPYDAKERQKKVDRSKEILEKSKLVNMGQYAHGIRSCQEAIEWGLGVLEGTHPSHWDRDKKLQAAFNRVYEYGISLAGYLYLLKFNH